MPLASADYPEWLALGCAADWIEREYDVGMRLWRDRPDIIVMGHWYFCPEGAYPVPYLHPWLASENQYGGTYLPTELGEVPSTIRYIKRPLNPRFTGLTPLGNADVWLNSSLYSGRPYWTVDSEGIPLAAHLGDTRQTPFRFGGAGQLGSGRYGSVLWQGAGRLLSAGSGVFHFGGGGMLAAIGSGASRFGGGGMEDEIGAGAFKFAGGGLLLSIGSGAFRMGGGGLLLSIGSGAFRMGGGGMLAAIGSGAFRFGGGGMEDEIGAGAFKFGGGGLLLNIGSGAFKFAGGGMEDEIGAGSFKFAGGGLLLAGVSVSNAGVFKFAGAGSNVGWSMSNSQSKYDFDRNEIGSGGGTGYAFLGSTSSGGTAQIAVGITGTYLVAKLTTGAISNAGLGAIQQNDNGQTAIYALQSNTSNEVEMRLYMPTLSTSGQRFKVQIGFGDTVTGTFTEGVWLEYTDNVNTGQWVMNTKKTSGGAGSTASNSTVAPVANTITTLRIKVTGTSAEFFADGVSLGTIATNVPSAKTGIVALIAKSVGTNALELSVDYVMPTITF